MGQGRARQQDWRIEKYYLKTYYFSKRTESSLEYLWQIQSFQQSTSLYNIYDIISAPNYTYSQFIYDSNLKKIYLPTKFLT